jgi:hypothetical protein
VKVAYIEVQPDEFEDADLIDELVYRGYVVFDKQQVPETASIEISGIVEALNDIYHAKREGKEYTEQLDDLIFKVLGRM